MYVMFPDARMVSMEKFTVNLDHKKNVELVCKVNAHPRLAVFWQKDGLNLVENPPRVTFTRERNNEKNFLVIKGKFPVDIFHKQDFI